MRGTIFDAIVSKLSALSAFQGSGGTTNVYSYAITASPSYPCAVVGDSDTVSDELDNQRDNRTYRYTIQVVGEKFGDQSSDHTQAQALEVMRNIEDTVLSAIDSDADLGVAGVIITRPVSVQRGFDEQNSRVILDIILDVWTTVDITL